MRWLLMLPLLWTPAQSPQQPAPDRLPVPTTCGQPPEASAARLALHQGKHAAPFRPLGRRIKAALRSSPAGARAFWGIEVADPGRGTVLYQLNAERLFVPASNAKLFTTALALVRLGPDYRFETTIRAMEAADRSGRIAGDLTLVGGGDPMLSARAAPYRKGPVTGEPLQAIEALADQVAARGVRRVDGDVIGDDTAYVWEPYPEGWTTDDVLWDWGAPVSALTVNDNVITITLRATEPGRPPAISLSPALEYYSIDNRVRVGQGFETKVNVERLTGSRELRLGGTLGAGAETTLAVAIDDPAAYAAGALKGALERRGVTIRGRAVARHRFENEVGDLLAGEGPPAPAAGVELARRVSPPLWELLQIIDKASVNLHAELMLCEVGRVRRGIGSREAGLEEMKAFLGEAGLDPSAYFFADGSGLSRYDLVTPEAVVDLLRHMYLSEHREQWLSLLPQGGEDGTLADRFSGQPAARRIHAKTGSEEHALALSGYAESKTHGMLVFSILANNFNAPAAEMRALADKIALLLVK